MSANVVLIDPETNEIVDEINFSKSITNREYIKPFIVKNVGDKKAYNINLEATYYTSEGSATFEDENLAASWKSFCFTRDGEYGPSLSLGDLNPNRAVEGKTNMEFTFTGPNETFVERWNTGITEWSAGGLDFVNNTRDGSGVSGRRIAIETGKTRDFEIQFKLVTEKDDNYTSDTNLQVNFCVRMNSNFNRVGYIISIQRRRRDGKLIVLIYKNGVGYTTNNNRDNGERIFSSSFIDYNENNFIKLKVYNDEEGFPCFEVLNNRENIRFNSSDGLDKNVKVAMDREKTFTKEGRTYLDSALWKGDVKYSMRDVSMTVDEFNHQIYVKTRIDDIAIDNKEYSSAINISFEEDPDEEV